MHKSVSTWESVCVFLYLVVICDVNNELDSNYCEFSGSRGFYG